MTIFYDKVERQVCGLKKCPPRLIQVGFSNAQSISKNYNRKSFLLRLNSITYRFDNSTRILTNK